MHSAACFCPPIPSLNVQLERPLPVLASGGSDHTFLISFWCLFWLALTSLRAIAWPHNLQQGLLPTYLRAKSVLQYQPL